MNLPHSWSETMPATQPSIEVKTRAIIYRDPLNGYLIHVRVLAYHDTRDKNTDATTPDFAPLDLSCLCENEFVPSYLGFEIPVAYAHFLLFRTDLATSGSELQEALSGAAEIFDDSSERAMRVSGFLTGKGENALDPEMLEEAMEVADDRWIDQVAMMDLFLHHRQIPASDLFGACIKELLCFTNPTSGMVVAAEYPAEKKFISIPTEDMGVILNDFAIEETDLRTAVAAYPHKSKDDTIWIVAGMAQAERSVDTSSRVRFAGPTQPA